MKLNDINQFIVEKKEEKEEATGTFVGMNPSAESKKEISAAIKELDVPNPNPTDQMHVTLIYSTKYLPDFKARGCLETPIIAEVSKLEIFTSKEGNNVLVVRLDSPELVARHEEIMDEHKARYGFKKFKTHLTLSYDCGDYDVKKHDIAKILETIEFTEEYGEDLNADWAKDNT